MDTAHCAHCGHNGSGARHRVQAWGRLRPRRVARLNVTEPGFIHCPSYVWYQDMADFADGISDERAGRRFARGDPKGGTFRRCKDELYEEYPKLLTVGYAFRGSQLRAMEWLVDNEIIDKTQVQKVPSEDSEPDLP
jgi:hypothetical protein